MEVTLEGQQELLRAFGKLDADIRREATKGLKRAGMSIVAAAQQNLRDGQNNTTGRLSNSGSVVAQKDGSVEAGFMQPIGENGNYAEYLETGTKPHWVSMKWLVPYMKKKHSRVLNAASAFGNVEGAEWAMAKAAQKTIAARGTKAHPYFAPAVKAHTQDVIDCLQDAINKAIRKNTR